MDDLENLSRRERRKLFREQKQDREEVRERTGSAVKWVVILVIVAAVGFGGWWFYKEITKPLPGQEIPDMGRNHTTDISGVTYNSDPPTSGPHFPVWAKRGLYDRVISDGHLVHSLEHGYVVASYNCDELKSQMSNVKTEESEATESAKPLTQMTVGVSGTMSFFTPQNPPPVEVELSESFKSEECKKLVSDLWGLVDGWDRVIVVPRPGMDTKIGLTGWGRIEELGGFDRERIKSFLSAFHNRGPERTRE